MLDTIKLTLDKTMFTILDINRFEKDLMNSTRGYFVMVQNPTTTELKQGIYKPRLTLTNRFNVSGRSEKTLAIEFSAPKLIYGNNFNELTNADFPDIIQKLKAVLRDMAIGVFEHILTNAPVSLVHYSKNIVLTDYTTPYTYLKELSKLNINLQLDTNKTDFRNEGHSFKCRSNSFELVFYDKIKDLQKARMSEKRAEEKDNAIQLDLLDLLKQQKVHEVLRMEVRLNKRSKINQVFNNIDEPTELTFKKVFDQDIAKQVLLYYLDKLEQAYPPLLMYQNNSPRKLFEGLLIANPKLNPSQALKMMAFRVLLDEVGVREYRQMTKRHGNYYWYSLNKEMKKLNKIGEVKVFSTLIDAVEKFEPLRLLANQDEMLNNDKYK